MTETPQAQVGLWNRFQSALATAEGKPGCPTDGLYLATVRDKVINRIATLPVPEKPGDANRVVRFLQDEKCERADVLERYRLAQRAK